jgi:hypothetical protein
MKPVFLLGCYGFIFQGTWNSARLYQNFGIPGGGEVENPPVRHCQCNIWKTTRSTSRSHFSGWWQYAIGTAIRCTSKSPAVSLIPNCGKFVTSTELQIYRMQILILSGTGEMQRVLVDCLLNVFYPPRPEHVKRHSVDWFLSFYNPPHCRTSYWLSYLVLFQRGRGEDRV